MTILSDDLPTTVLDETNLSALVVESARVHVEIHSDGRVLVDRGTVELSSRACLSASTSRDGLMPPRPATPAGYKGTTHDTRLTRSAAKPRARTTPFASLVRLAIDAGPREERLSVTHAEPADTLAGGNVFDLASRFGRMMRRTAKSTVSAAGEPAIGQHLPDDTVYAGISPATGQPMYTTTKDSCLCESWTDAMNYAANVTMHGHDDWRAPTKAELHQLFTHRAAIGNFNELGHITRGRYWSSSPEDMTCAWAQPLLDGSPVSVMALRCVRG